jgi:hypothetical protein
MAQTIPYATNSFAAGEWDPQLLASTDLAKYKTANKVMRNFFAHVNGKASNRAGTIMVGQTATSTTNQSAVQNTRVIPFIFNTSQSYVIEFSNNIVRFIKNGAYILSSPGVIYSITSSYSSAQVMQLGYTQSADTIFLAHPNVAPQMLQRISDTNWTLTPYPYQFGPWLLDNTNLGYTLTPSAFGSTYATSSVIPVGVQVTLTASGATANTPFVSSHVGALWEIYHYVPNQTVNNASSVPTSSISCGGTWRFITNGTWTGDVWVEKSLDGGITWLQLNYYNAVSNFNVNTFGTEDVSNNAPPFLVRVNGTISSGTIEITLTCDPYIQPGMIQITGYTSSTIVTGVVTQPIGLNKVASTDWAEGAWSTYRGWPSTVEFSPDDRLCWANTPYQPITSFITQTGNYYSFNVNSPLEDSDALNINLPSRQLNAINSLIPLRAILALTSGGEWSIESTNGVTAPLTPSTVYQRVHGYEGSTQVRPLTIGIRAIFVQALGKVIRDVGYELIFDSFVGANISLFSNHLFYFDNIVDMCYCQNPDSLVWLVMSSGKLVSLTYLREQQVVTFAPHDTFGKFMSCCSIADTVNNYNVPYFVVNRANGQFIEYMPKRMATTNIQDQYFVDCGGVYDALGQTFQNANLDTFSFGPNYAPDYWTLSQSGTVSQTSAPTTTPDNITNVENGNASTFLQGTNPILYQRMDQAYGMTYWQGRAVTFSVFCRCFTPNTAYAGIYDGITSIQSAAHPGDGSWQLLTATGTISNSGTTVHVHCKVVNGSAYFNNSYFNSGVSSITGATWLNGQTVAILADGFILPTTTVQNGVISWVGGANYNKIAYGLPFVAQLQPTTPYVPMPVGTMQAHTINIGKAVIGVWNTASGYVGTDFENMKPIPDLAIVNYDPPAQPLFTGNVGAQLGSNAQTENSICIEQSDPLPMTVTFIVQELQISGLPANQT